MKIGFFWKKFTLKLFQKGNQLTIQGNKKNTDILKNAITQTISEKKMNKAVNNNINSMQENLKKSMSNDIKNINITKTVKLDVVGKSKLQNTYLEILQKKQIVFAVGPAGTGKTFLAVAAAVSQLLEKKFDRIILSNQQLRREKNWISTWWFKGEGWSIFKATLWFFMWFNASDIALRKIQSSELKFTLAFVRERTLNNSFDFRWNSERNTSANIFLTRCDEIQESSNWWLSQTDLNRRSIRAIINNRK